MIATRGSWHFNTILSSSGFVYDWDPSPINVTLGLTTKKFAWETLRGAAFYSGIVERLVFMGSLSLIELFRNSWPLQLEYFPYL